MKNKNISISLEIINIYLAYLEYIGKENEVKKLNEVRNKLYRLDEPSINITLNQYAKTLFDKKNNKYNVKKLDYYKLDDDEFDKLYNKAEKYILGDNKKNYNNPTAIIIGGQQGSGKTKIVLESLKDFDLNNEDALVLDLDIYRGFYKNYFELLLNYPDSYAKITNPFIGKVMERLTRKVIDNKYNFIFEGTMGKSTYTLDLLLKSKIKYNIIVKILAVSREESLLSIFERYIEMKKRTNLGRLTTIEEHDDRYEKFTETVKTLELKNVEVEVYERIDDNNLNMIYKTTTNNNKFNSAIEALEYGRKKSFNRCMLTSKERVRKINENINHFGELGKLSDQINKLNNIFDYSD